MKRVIIFVLPALILLSMAPGSLVPSDSIGIELVNFPAGLTVKPIDDARGVPQGKINALVKKLGSEDIEERLAARSTLLRIGAPARDALQKALKSQDLEIAFAADLILSALDKIRFIAHCRTTDSSSLEGKFLKVKIIQLPDDGNIDRYRYGYDSRNMQGDAITLPISSNGVVFLPTAAPEHRYLIQLSIDGYDTISAMTPRLQNMPVLLTATFSPTIIRGDYPDNRPPSKTNPKKKMRTITGRVVDVKNNNAPVSGCNLYAGNNISDVSASDGTFKLEGAHISRYLHINMEGWRQVEIEWKKLEGGNWEATVKVMEEKWFRGKLAFTLIKPDGKPLSATEYRIGDQNDFRGHIEYWRWRQQSTKFPKTGKDGSIELERMIDDSGKLIIYIPGYAPINLSDYKLKGNETVMLEKPLQLSRGREMSVSVVDDSGKPVAGALIVMNYPGYRAINIGTRFLRECRRPEFKKMFAFHPRYCVADSKGNVKITGLGEKQFNLRVMATNYIPSNLVSVKVKPDDTFAPQKITLIRTCSMTIRRRKGGHNFSFVALSLHEDDKSNRKDGGVCFYFDNPTSQGTYDFDGGRGHFRKHSYLRPGEHSFIIYVPGSKPKGICRELKAGEDAVEEISLELIKYGSISGKIKFGDGIERKDIGEAHLGLVGGDVGLEPLRLRIAEDGSFVVKRVAEGRNYISVRHSDGKLLGFYSVDIVAGKNSQVEIKVAQARVKGVLYDAAGVPQALQLMKITRIPRLSSQEMSVIPDSRNNAGISRGYRKPQPIKRMQEAETQTTNLKGEFTFTALVAGRYIIFSKQTPLGVVVDVKPGENVIDVRPVQASISGKVIGLGTQKAQVSLLRVYHDPEDVAVLARKCYVGKDGAFKLENVPPGDYMVIAALQNVTMKCVARLVVKDATPVDGVELAWPAKESMRVLRGRITNYAPPRISNSQNNKMERMYHVLIDTPTNPMSESITDVNNQGKNKDSIAPYVLISGAYRSVAKVNVDGTFQIELPAGKYKLAVPGLYLNTDNAAHAAKVYEITIDADKPVTDVEIPPKKIEPAPKPAPAPEQPRTGPFEPPPAP